MGIYEGNAGSSCKPASKVARRGDALTLNAMHPDAARLPVVPY
jgi:hypothetical protein